MRYRNRFKQTQFYTGYWVEPPFDKLAARRYKEIADCGFNLVLSGFENAPSESFAPLLRRNRLKCILMNRGGDSKNWPKDETVIGYGLLDEPKTSQFLELRDRATALRESHPGTIPFVNLFPNYASSAQLGAATYDGYVAEFIRIYQPEVLCMDNYPIFKPGKDTRQTYIDNLDIFRKHSLAANIPFWNFYNFMPYGPHTDPTEAQLRWQVNASLVYGAKGLLSFCYFTPAGDEFPKGGAIIARDGAQTHHYQHAKRLNQTLHAFGRVLIDCTSIDVARISPTDIPIEKLSRSAIKDLKRDAVDPFGDYLVGTFSHRSGRRAVLLMNYQFAYSAWPTVIFDTADTATRVTEIDPITGREKQLRDESPAMEGFQVPLSDGGARLFLIG